MDALFLELGSILALATVLGLLCHYLRQPLIFAYLLTGILVSLFGLNRSLDPRTLHTFSELGITLLLFLVGLELNTSELRRLGPSMILTAMCQMTVVGLSGFAVGMTLGLGVTGSLYLALSITFSSTIIAVKWLTDQRATQSLHGRLAMGLLLIQDVIALGALIVLASLSHVGSQMGGMVAALMLVKGAVLLVGNVVVSRYLVPKLFRSLARSGELLFLGSIGWCVLLAALSQWLGFSIEIGAFLAGLGLAHSSYQFQIAARIKPLRDFFVILFFIVLGLGLVLDQVVTMLVPAIMLSLMVVTIGPFTVAIVLGWFGYKRHTRFFTAMLFGQVGEFSLVVVALGLSLGQITAATSSLVTLVVLLTILLSSYGVTHQQRLYRRLQPMLQWMGQRGRTGGTHHIDWRDHVVMLGCHRLGADFLTTLRQLHDRVVIVDYDPEQVEQLEKVGTAVLYGDMMDAEVLEEAGVHRARLVVSTILNRQATIHLLRHRGTHQSSYIVTAETGEEALEYYRLGADYVIIPLLLGGKAVADLVKYHWSDLHAFETTRLNHLQMLAARRVGEA